MEAARFLEDAIHADSAAERGLPAAPQPLQNAVNGGAAGAGAAAQLQQLKQQLGLASSPSQTSGFWTGAAAATWVCQRGSQGQGEDRPPNVRHSSQPAAAGQLPAAQATSAQLACHSAQLLAVHQR